jgi:hypothetical protein
VSATAFSPPEPGAATLSLMFKRPQRDAPGTSKLAAPANSGGRPTSAPTKGKATRKRRDAQAARRVSAIGQTGLRSGRGARLTPEQTRARREAMRRGDQSVLPARDRGPARAFARDYVDSRRNVLGLFMPVAVVVILFGYSHQKTLVPIATGTFLVFLVGSVADTAFLILSTRKQLAVRFPEEPVRGIGIYATMRAMQFRKMRLPGPRVERGAKV